MVIKPHPGDTMCDWHNKILEKEDYSATLLDPKANTFEALFASDIVLTITSTTAIEAMILGKLVVIVNLTGKPDPMPYVVSGAALGAYKEDDVLPAIEKALLNKKCQEELAMCAENFVREHTYQVGKATENVINLLKIMVGS
jgi:predicted glycosyltransferase